MGPLSQSSCNQGALLNTGPWEKEERLFLWVSVTQFTKSSFPSGSEDSRQGALEDEAKVL